MTKIDFHILPAQARRQHDVYVCELVDHAYRAGRRVHLHCLDDDMVTAMDDLLWTWHDTSFIPHAVAGSPEAAEAPVILAASTEAPDAADLLVNLHCEVPDFFSQFEQVIEQRRLALIDIAHDHGVPPPTVSRPVPRARAGRSAIGSNSPKVSGAAAAIGSVGACAAISGSIGAGSASIKGAAV